MKKLLVMVVAMACLFVAHAQATDSVSVVKDSVKLSGNLTFLSMTNSLFTGGYFSVNPAICGSVDLSYKGFGINVMRNSDLLDHKSGANVFAFTPTYSKTFGKSKHKFNVFVAAEIDFQDYVRELNLVAPYTTLSYRGVVNIEAMFAYVKFLEGGDANIQRLAISKEYQGFTFKAYFWNVNWGGSKQNCALEISKQFGDHFRVSVYGHLNDLSRKVSCFGAVRIGVSF
ncbi:MAG: hypothetical protein LBI53_05375 [Candidatus Peribacteria bacterium]|jgi:hypothetical protein|nr:hypothetical protein [Candidatus Peribacteria bacterium]